MEHPEGDEHGARPDARRAVGESSAPHAAIPSALGSSFSRSAAWMKHHGPGLYRHSTVTHSGSTQLRPFGYVSSRSALRGFGSGRRPVRRQRQSGEPSRGVTRATLMKRVGRGLAAVEVSRIVRPPAAPRFHGGRPVVVRVSGRSRVMCPRCAAGAPAVPELSLPQPGVAAAVGPAPGEGAPVDLVVVPRQREALGQLVAVRAHLLDDPSELVL
jgi:hypothetical protein